LSGQSVEFSKMVRNAPAGISYSRKVVAYVPHGLFRRDFLQIASFAMFGASVSVRSELTPPPISDAHATVGYIRRNCAGYLRAFGRQPIQPMWRGGDAIGIQHPPSDLLDKRVYGEAGILFFSALAEVADETKVKPADAHIATGSSEDALAWGPPVSIWPIGDEFHFIFWATRSLIYDSRQDDLAENSIEDVLARLGPPVIGQNLDEALTSSKEVLFQMSEDGYLVLPCAITDHVVSLLNAEWPHIRFSK
jgi:hypothetical protein